MIDENYIVDDDVKEILKLIDEKSPVIYVSGKAGVGKSSFIKYFRNTTKKKHVVLAPTGVAALNVGAQTIHSFFRFPFHMLSKLDIKYRKDNVMDELEVLIIDEISMVRSDVMDAIDLSLRMNRRRPNEPFGGVQMILVGDCFQLSPVVTYNEQRLYETMYDSAWFFDAEVFEEIDINMVELSHIYRQDDNRLIKILNNIRVKHNIIKTLQALNTICYHRKTDHNNGDIYLSSTNASVDRINYQHLNNIEGKMYTYDAQLEGEFKGDKLSVPLELKVKLNSRVMIRKKIEGAINGSMGHVVGCSDDVITVRLDTGAIIDVERETWESYKYVYDVEEKQIVPEVVNKIVQFPLSLGWAITIHKSQGLTLENVELDIHNGAFAHGQVYVALSRCRNIDSLKLTYPILAKDIIIDERILDFYNRYEVE